MAVFYCDTDCELWYTKAEEQKIGVIKMPYTIDGVEEYYDLGKKCDIKGFFKKMRDGASALTAALNAEEYKEIFEPHFKAGEDILYVAFSSQMSGTFNSMRMAVDELKQKYPNVRFECFDTLSISLGAGVQVYMAAKFFNENGQDIDKTLEYLTKMRDRVGTYFIVNDLKYLARGGRLEPSKAKIGNLLSLKPILKIDNAGKLDVFAKQNGFKKALSFVVSEMKERFEPFDDMPLIIIDADCPELADELQKKVETAFEPEKVVVERMSIGPVIGAHCGPDTIGLVFPAKER